MDIKGDVRGYAIGNIQAEAQKNISAKADRAVAVDAGATATITAPKITLNVQTTINGSLSQDGGSNGSNAFFKGSLHTIDDITTDSDVVARFSLNGIHRVVAMGGQHSSIYNLAMLVVLFVKVFGTIFCMVLKKVFDQLLKKEPQCNSKKSNPKEYSMGY